MTKGHSHTKSSLSLSLSWPVLKPELLLKSSLVNRSIIYIVDYIFAEVSSKQTRPYQAHSQRSAVAAEFKSFDQHTCIRELANKNCR